MAKQKETVADTFTVTLLFESERIEIKTESGTKVEDFRLKVSQNLNLTARHYLLRGGIELWDNYKIEPDDEITVTPIVVSFGDNAIDGTEYNGKTVSDIRAETGKALGLPKNGKPIVKINGVVVALDSVLGFGERMEFITR